METNKEKILQSVNKYINETFKELDVVKDKISLEDKKLISLTLEYVTLSKEISDSRRQLDIDFSNLKRSEALFETEKDNFKNEVIKFNQNKSRIESDLQNKLLARTRLESEIQTLSSKLQSLDFQIKAKETITSELENTGKLISEKSKELLELQDIFEELQKSISRTKLEAEKQLKVINIDIEKRQGIVFPTINALEEREKKVKEREDNINIIIERYKKLYADKGAGFRV
jgi:chromosome segregation ATPase